MVTVTERALLDLASPDWWSWPPAAFVAHRSAPTAPRALATVTVSPDAVLEALGDRTRRAAVLRTIAEDGPATATELAGPLGIGRQAVSKHLGVLTDAGMLRADRVGRESRYRLVAEGLAPATTWLEGLGSAWEGRMARPA